MNAVDTNILFYVHDPRDVTKRYTATTLVKSLADGVLLWQVACEYLAASRKLEPLGYSSAQAWQYIRELQDAWETFLPTWETLDRAEVLLRRYRLSSWDALIIAACLQSGVTRLYSEDLDASVRAEGLEIVNPRLM
ncbi:MAG: PIN domain-containing protein [Acidobacteriota bacterium]|nr:PIN domain-containing protein [Acidobacteriota bacterium]